MVGVDSLRPVEDDDTVLADGDVVLREVGVDVADAVGSRGLPEDQIQHADHLLGLQLGVRQLRAGELLHHDRVAVVVDWARDGDIWVERFERLVFAFGGFPGGVEPGDVVAVGGVVARLHHLPEVGVPLAVELQRELPVGGHLVHVRLLPHTEGCADARDRVAFGERVERERVVPLEGEPVAVVLDRLPLDEVAVGTPVEPVGGLLVGQIGELRQFLQIDPLGEPHPLFESGEEVEVLRLEVGDDARDVLDHTLSGGASRKSVASGGQSPLEPV